MTRILRIVNRFNIGGPTYNAAYLSKYLSPEFETRLLAGTIDKTEGSSTYLLDQMGVPYTIIPEMQRSLHPWKDYLAFRRIVKEIREYKPDIVHTHASKAGALGRLAAIYCRVPVLVHTFHGNVLDGYFNPVKTAIFLGIERVLARKSNAIIAISPCQRTELLYKYKLCEPLKISTIPLGFDLSRFQQDREVKRKNFRQTHGLDQEIAIGIIGRLVPIKDHELFLKSIAWLKAHTTRSFRVFIVGDGELRSSLEIQAKKLGLGPDLVVFTGWTREIDVILPGFDVVALTSKNEGTPVSLIEAQASGIAVATMLVGGVSDAVLSGISALTCKQRNPEAFGQLLKTLTEDDAIREYVQKQGTDFVFERFRYTRLVTDIKKLYKELLPEGGK